MTKKAVFIILILILAFALLCSCKAKEVKLTKYTIEMVLDSEDMKIYACESVIYTNNSDTALNTLKFHLYPDAFSEDAETPPVTERHINSAYYDGMSYGGIDIIRVEINGKAVAFCEDNQLLEVDIPELKPNEQIELNMRYHLDLPKVKHRFGYNDFTVNLANFYPIACMLEDNSFREESYCSLGDPFHSELADYEVKLKADNDYLIAATGEITKKSVNVNTSSYIFKAERVRDFAMVLSKEFRLITEEWNGKAVNYYYYQDAEPEKSLKQAVTALKTFSAVLGEYPYSTYNVVETEFAHGGMEYPQLVYISSSLTDLREKVIAHETAHQWMYGLIGSDAIKEAWIDEGLTEFLTALYFLETDREDEMKKMINESYNSYAAFINIQVPLQLKQDTSMNRALNEYQSEFEYVNMVYTKGMLMFNTIYEIQGRKRFMKCLNKLYDNHLFKTVSGEDIINIFSEGNKAVRGVFEAWLNGKVVITTFYN
ncbi:MAG: M1 family metallopeptidase [Christensenellales bacterium]